MSVIPLAGVYKSIEVNLLDSGQSMIRGREIMEYLLICRDRFFNFLVRTALEAECDTKAEKLLKGLGVVKAGIVRC